MVETDRPHRWDSTIRHVCFACWITKATNTHSEYVILNTFPRQTCPIVTLYIHCLYCYNTRRCRLTPAIISHPLQTGRVSYMLQVLLSLGRSYISRSCDASSFYILMFQISRFTDLIVPNVPIPLISSRILDFSNSFFFNGKTAFFVPWPVLYCIVVGSQRLMPPDALQPKAYCTNPGL